MALPSFLCVGAQKAGTTWLYWQLREHPDVWMPPLKEIHYFDHLYVEEVRQWSLWHLKSGIAPILRWHVNNHKNVNFHYVRYLSEIVDREPFTESWYERIFSYQAANGKVTGDITPEYCTIGDDGISFLKRLLGNPKIIYIIRDPISRALSQLRMNISRNPIDGSEGEWLKAASNPVLRQRGDYASYIPQWKRNFHQNDMLFIPYKMLKRDPISVLREIEAHVGLASHTYSKPKDEIHVTQEIEIPQEIVQNLTEELMPQRRFLIDEFGSEFAQLT